MKVFSNLSTVEMIDSSGVGLQFECPILDNEVGYFFSYEDYAYIDEDIAREGKGIVEYDDKLFSHYEFSWEVKTKSDWVKIVLVSPEESEKFPRINLFIFRYFNSTQPVSIKIERSIII